MSHNTEKLKEWLIKIGLEEKADEYAAAFVTGGYTSLHELQSAIPTNDILKDIGISLPAHRARILNNVQFGATTEPKESQPPNQRQRAGVSIKLIQVQNAVPDTTPVFVSASLITAEGENVQLKNPVSSTQPGPSPKFHKTLTTKGCKFNTELRVYDNVWESLIVKLGVYQVVDSQHLMIGHITQEINGVEEGNIKLKLDRTPEFESLGDSFIHFSITVRKVPTQNANSGARQDDDVRTVLSLCLKSPSLGRYDLGKGSALSSSLPLLMTNSNAFGSPLGLGPGLGAASSPHLSPMSLRNSQQFINWGHTVSKKAGYTFYPKSKNEAIDIVRKAIAAGVRVRGAGYRHTWSDLYIDNGDWVVCFVPDLHDQAPAKKLPYNPDNDLMKIAIEGKLDDKTLVRVGPGTTNTMLRDWCNKNELCYPYNVVMVEITVIGCLSTLCHGSGVKNGSLPELVHEIEFVNAAGTVQKLTAISPEEKELMKSAAGCFGLLGITLSVVLKLEKMKYALLDPLIIPLSVAVPPPDADEQYDRVKKDVQQFEARLEKYYNEFFWFTGTSNAFVNCWDVTDNATGASFVFPTHEHVYIQQQLSNFANVSDGLFKLFTRKTQSAVFAKVAMQSISIMKPQKVSLPNGLHFQQGIHNLPCWCFEGLFPIPCKADNTSKFDWLRIRKVWWGMVKLIEEFKKENKFPCQVMEMRVIKASDITMSPQNFGQPKSSGSSSSSSTGNYCVLSIECISFQSLVPSLELHEFVQAVVDKWTSYVDVNGNPIPFKFHWAKQWDHFTVKGKPYLDYASKIGFPTQIAKFKKDIKEICKLGGTKFKYTVKHFSNNTLDFLLGESQKPPLSYLEQTTRKSGSPQKTKRSSSPNPNRERRMINTSGSSTPTNVSAGGSPETVRRRSPFRQAPEGEVAPTTRIVLTDGQTVTREIGGDDD